MARRVIGVLSEGKMGHGVSNSDLGVRGKRKSCSWKIERVRDGK